MNNRLVKYECNIPLTVHIHWFSAVLEALYECQPPRPLSPIEPTLALIFATNEKPFPVSELAPIFRNGRMCCQNEDQFRHQSTMKDLFRHWSKQATGTSRMLTQFGAERKAVTSTLITRIGPTAFTSYASSRDDF